MTGELVERPGVPVRLDEQPDAISVFVGEVKVAAAWGPAADGTGEWFLAKTGAEPYRVHDRGSALAILGDLRDQRAWREAAVWQPGDPEPSVNDTVPTVPAGVQCWSCGDDLSGAPIIAVPELTFPGDTAPRRYYTCDHCDCYLDDLGDDDDA